MIKYFRSIKLFLVIIVYLSNIITADDSTWVKVEDGLYIGYFKAELDSPAQGYDLTIIKIDPNYYEFNLLCSDELNKQNSTAREWSEKYNLIGL